MRLIQILLCIIAVPFLVISLYQFINRYADWQNSRIAEQHHIEKIKELKKTRDSLKNYIKSFESNELAQERLARRFGYIKHGEIVYQIKRETKAKKREDESYLGGFIVK